MKKLLTAALCICFFASLSSCLYKAPPSEDDIFHDSNRAKQLEKSRIKDDSVDLSSMKVQKTFKN